MEISSSTCECNGKLYKSKISLKKHKNTKIHKDWQLKNKLIKIFNYWVYVTKDSIRRKKSDEIMKKKFKNNIIIGTSIDHDPITYCNKCQLNICNNHFRIYE